MSVVNLMIELIVKSQKIGSNLLSFYKCLESFNVQSFFPFKYNLIVIYDSFIYDSDCNSSGKHDSLVRLRILLNS